MLARRTPLARTAFKQVPSSQKPRKPMRQVAKGKTKGKRSRATLVGSLAAQGIVCEICPELLRHGVPIRCTGFSELHERRKRSSAGSLEHAVNCLPICRAANLWIEDQAGEARARFGSWLVLREGDLEWVECGLRATPSPVIPRSCEECGRPHVTVPPSGFLPCGHRSDG